MEDKLGFIMIIDSITPPPTGLTIVDQLKSRHPELFNAICKLKSFQVMLHMNKDIQPTCQLHRRVLFHVWIKAKTELQHLEAKDTGIA